MSAIFYKILVKFGKISKTEIFFLFSLPRFLGQIFDLKSGSTDVVRKPVRHGWQVGPDRPTWLSPKRSFEAGKDLRSGCLKSESCTQEQIWLQEHLKLFLTQIVDFFFTKIIASCNLEYFQIVK